MNEKTKNLIKELLDNNKQSDREIARKIGATQPTVGRLRNRLINEDYIRSYSVIPNLSKLNVELIAFTVIKWKDYKQKEKLEKFGVELKKNNLMFFCAPGEGFNNKTKIMITFHEDYKSYELFLTKLRSEWEVMIEDMDSFLVSTDNIIKNFDFGIVGDFLTKKD